MKQVIQNMRTGQTSVMDVPIPILQPKTALVKTAASLVSAGTERSVIDFAEKNILAKAQSRPDLMKQVVDKAKREGVFSTIDSAFNRLDQPLTLGYSSAGTIIEIGAGLQNYKAGDRVVCTGGNHAVHAEYAVIPQNLMAHLPENIDFESGAFAGLGAIALHGIRLADIQIGEKVAVIGLGLLGLLTAQLLQANGCDVFGFELHQKKIQFARMLNIMTAPNDKGKKQTISFTKGRGFDAVLICAATTSNDTVVLAGEIARDRARIISLGVVGLELPRKTYFEKELFFQVSRSAGPGRYDKEYEENGHDYPIGYVRWSQGRNLEAFVDLLKMQKIDVSPLVTHRFQINKAEQAYQIITGKKQEPFLGIILKYEDEKKTPRRPIVIEKTAQKREKGVMTVGVIGAGNFANSVFLPVIKKNPTSRIESICSASGVSAAHAAQKLGIPRIEASIQDTLSNRDIDTVTILTRHSNHAKLVLDALHQGKNVYCEKPLALLDADIQKIESLIRYKSAPYLMVGFNRRFSRLAERLKDALIERPEPLFAYYRVNAGYLPLDHWLHDPEQGGGRIIGEGCHFIDFLTFLVGNPPKSVQTSSLPDKGKYHQDNISIHLEFPDGSIGQIAYLSNGNKRVAKEFLELFCAGQVATLNDFKTLEIIKDNYHDKQTIRWGQDKGHARAWQAFSSAIINSEDPPIPYTQLIAVSRAAIFAQKSLESGERLFL